MVRRAEVTGSLVGYVKVPHDHPFYRRKYTGRVERTIKVHGGITFSGKPMRFTGGRLRGYWFGFDCGHAWDFMPAMPKRLQRGEYRDFAYVKAQTESMAKQLKKAAK
jgi:hypothetical protein